MILPDFILHSRINQRWEYSGIDSPDRCVDPQQFKNYPHAVEYQYNSRGFRDDEWPSDLNDVVWCVGDSFTSGIGSPRSHTWPWLLQSSIQRRTINVSLDGASNNWIARKTLRLLEAVKPQCIVIHWSYLHRRESDIPGSDEERRRHIGVDSQDNDVTNTLQLIDTIEQRKQTTKIIHSFIPEFAGKDKAEFEQKLLTHTRLIIPEFRQLDLARDGHHYDRLTASILVSQIVRLL